MSSITLTGVEKRFGDVENVATAGPVIGPYDAVRIDVVNAMNAMLTQGVDPKTALRNAAEKADEEISSYNARVG